MLESGVSSYVHASAKVDVYFPVDAKGQVYMCCQQCPFYSPSTNRCRLNNEPILFPNKYCGQKCPLELDKEN